MIKYYLLGVVIISIQVRLYAQNSTQWGPDGFVKIEEGSGGFYADLDLADRFSRDHDGAGDINGDGVLDMVVGARSDDDGATDAGAVYILFMNNDGTVLDNQKISMVEGGFDEVLNEGNFFGYGVAGIGDYDADGIPDIAVSAPVPPNHAIYIIHLFSDGTVKDFVKNANITAQGLSAVGDLNDDGRIDLVACDPGADLEGTDSGAIRILFFNENSLMMPLQTVLIGPNTGGFGEGIQSGDEFGGREVAMLGDINGDGTLEMAVGAFMSDGGKGAIWMLSLDSETLLVESKLKITEGMNGFDDVLTTGDNPNGTAGANFGHALCKVGDLNGDNVPDLMTGANQQNEGWGYILYLNPDGTVKTYTRLNNTDGGFGIELEAEERFSRSISFLGDLRGDGTLAVNYGGGAGGTGTLYLLFFKPCTFEQLAQTSWTEGNQLFSNWDVTTQTFTSSPISFEQCTFKAFELNAPVIAFDSNDGKCTCLDAGVELVNTLGDWNIHSNLCFDSEVGISEFQYHDQLFAYPNPSSGIFQFKTIVGLQNAVYEVMSSNGEVIEEGFFQSEMSDIDITEYADGIYFLRVISANSIDNLLLFKN